VGDGKYHQSIHNVTLEWIKIDAYSSKTFSSPIEWMHASSWVLGRVAWLYFETFIYLYISVRWPFFFTLKYASSIYTGDQLQLQLQLRSVCWEIINQWLIGLSGTFSFQLMPSSLVTTHINDWYFENHDYDSIAFAEPWTAIYLSSSACIHVTVLNAVCLPTLFFFNPQVVPMEIHKTPRDPDVLPVIS